MQKMEYRYGTRKALFGKGFTTSTPNHSLITRSGFKVTGMVLYVLTHTPQYNAGFKIGCLDKKSGMMHMGMDNMALATSTYQYKRNKRL
jgi:hypothetical protein